MKIFQTIIQKILTYPKAWISVIGVFVFVLIAGNVYQCSASKEDELLKDLETLSNEQAVLLERIDSISRSSQENINSHQFTIDEIQYVNDTLKIYSENIEYELEVLQLRISNNRQHFNKSRNESNTNFNESDDDYRNHIADKWARLGRPANQ